jgi:hypothetical protein
MSSIRIIRSIFILGVLTTLVLSSVTARDIAVSISAPSQVAVGERFRLVYSVNARPSEFNAPQFTDFRVLSGPSQSTSTSTQIINNQVTTSFTISYTYLLEATKEGSFSIDAAHAVVDGTTYTSSPYTITVSGQASSGASPSAPPSQQPDQHTGTRITSRDIFVRAELSNNNPYQSEQVIVTYKLYTRLPISRYSIEKLPSYQGFWSENLSDTSQPQATTEVIDGIQYSVAEIRRIAIFPQRSGELRIEPLEVECLVRLRSQQRGGSIFDDFFGGSVFGNVQNVPHLVRSNPIALQVKPLPSQNRPSSFKGQVGTYDMTVSLTESELDVNDATNLKIRIQGNGNIRMVEKPDINFPQNLEVFDPNVSDNIRHERSGVRGSREYDMVIIPRTPGEFIIPSIQFSYFDPTTSQYVNRSAGPFTLNVTGSAGMAGDPTSYGRSEFQRLSTDIRFIVTRPFQLLPAGKLFYKSKTFYILLTLPFILFTLLLLIWRRQLKLRGNAALLRNKKAEQLARKRLKKAASFMRNKKELIFYDEIFRALWGYLSDKLSIPQSKLNKEVALTTFRQKGISEEIANDFIDVLNNCEFARFAPTQSGNQMESIYGRAVQSIVNLEKEIRNKRSKTT